MRIDFDAGKMQEHVDDEFFTIVGGAVQDVPAPAPYLGVDVRGVAAADDKITNVLSCVRIAVLLGQMIEPNGPRY